MTDSVTVPTTEPEKLAQPAKLMRPPHAEQEYALELEALAAQDTRPRPPSWNLSPWAVVTYLLGGTLDDGTVISPKYVGPRRLMEVAVATLATDRALLLLGGSRYGQDLGLRTPFGRNLGCVDAPGSRHVGYARGSYPLRLELRTSSLRGADRRCAGAFSRDDGDGNREDRPR